MADLTTNNTGVAISGGSPSAVIITDAVTIGIGALVQLESGLLNHWDETGTFMGVMVGGDSNTNTAVILGATSDDSPPEGHIREGATLRGTAPAGTPTQAKVGDLVYSADSDPASLTMTDTTNPPVGRLYRFHTATNCDVKLFTPSEFQAGIADATWNV